MRLNGHVGHSEPKTLADSTPVRLGAPGTLKLLESSASSGTDPFGAYQSTTFKWASTASSETQMVASIRTYESDPGLMVFEQAFPNTISGPGASVGADPTVESGSGARTLFPSFDKASPAGGLPAFAYHGVFPGMKCTTVKDYTPSHQGGAPLVIYDNTDPSVAPANYSTIVFSPLSFPKAHHMTATDGYFGAGVKDTVTEIPAGWSQLFVLSAGKGINAGMMAWGDRMLKFTGKPRADKYRDTTHSTIGFWTDNGGYYHCESLVSFLCPAGDVGPCTYTPPQAVCNADGILC